MLKQLKAAEMHGVSATMLTSWGGRRGMHQEAACSALVNSVTASCGFCVGTKPYCDRNPAQHAQIYTVVTDVQ